MTSTQVPDPTKEKGQLLHEARLKGEPLQPCPECGHRDVRAYGQLLVCAVCTHVFWRPES